MMQHSYSEVQRIFHMEDKSLDKNLYNTHIKAQNFEKM